MTIFCELCGTTLHADHLFCFSCAAAAPRGTRRADTPPEVIEKPQYCPACGHGCPEGSGYCTSCGQNYFERPLEADGIVCPGCGSKNSGSARVCYQCSLSLTYWFDPQGEGARRQAQDLPFVLTESMNGYSYVFTNADKITIGREPENDIIIPCGFVSGNHLEVDFAANKLRDLSSTNGSYINR